MNAFIRTGLLVAALKANADTPGQQESNRQKSLDACKRFRDAQVQLERTCKELGIEVPVMVC